MLLQFLLVNLIHISLCQYNTSSSFPKFIFKAYKPKGFEVSTNISEKAIIVPVTIDYNVNNGSWRTGNFINSGREWRFFDPDMQLHFGDAVDYAISMENQSTKCISHPSTEDSSRGCLHSYITSSNWPITDFDVLCEAQHLPTVSSQNCSDNATIFEDYFADATLNRKLWTVEQYIPQYSEDNYEFVSYQDDDDCIFLSDSKLHLKPVILENSQLYGTLDLQNRCSRNTTHACIYRQIGANYLPPVKSGKIVSNFAFRYGKVEIRAKLPLGDWIYPQIELIPLELTKKYPKFLIAYSRGNKKLKTKEGQDIGANVLLGGRVAFPAQTYNFSRLIFPRSIGEKMEVYSLTWTPNKIILAINDLVYSTTYQQVNDGIYRIALGVGVGGHVDFPDDVVSGGYTKPWKNDAAKQVKDFVDAKSAWTKSWSENDVTLQVDYVRVLRL